MHLARLTVVCFITFTTGIAVADDVIKLKNKPLDEARLYVEQLDRDTAIHIENFAIDDAGLGKSKHKDVALQAAQAAPHLLAADIVNELREFGFTNVTLDESDNENEDGLELEGQFTQINPGSQAARAWLGFGAGQSKVCVEAVLKDESDTMIGEFNHCSKGIGWGESGSQLENDADRLGHQFALLMRDWADGKFVR
jgi:hypothetical protein